MPEALAVQGVTKVYPGGNRALGGVSFRVEASTFLVLLGPSGSGKTTLLRTVAGIEPLSGGRIAIGETVVAGDGLHLPPERRDLSMVFQDYALWPHLTAQDNVGFALRRRGHSRTACRGLAWTMLDRMGLAGLAGRYPGQLSGGEQQRVSLARALVADTGLLLCDEPLSNLDADLRERIRTEISTLVRQAGATTVYITHDQHEAFALADLVGVLDGGRLVQMGTPEEIYRAPANPFVARFTGLAGELAVRVCGPAPRSDRLVVVPSGPPARLPVEARAGVPAPVAGPALLTVRPGAVRIGAAGSEQSHLDGVVVDVAFRGRHYEVTVDLPGGGRMSNVPTDVRMRRGSPVGLHLDPEGCTVFVDADAGNGDGADRATSTDPRHSCEVPA